MPQIGVIEPTSYSLDNPYAVQAKAVQQCGYEVLVAGCPRCGHTHAVNGPGRIVCNCGLWIRLDK